MFDQMDVRSLELEQQLVTAAVSTTVGSSCVLEQFNESNLRSCPT